MDVRLQPLAPLRGRLRVPGDKSISHRLLILGALASGESFVRGLAPGADVASSARCLAALGVPLVPEPAGLRIGGVGLAGLLAPQRPLDCGNSGTTLRLLAGLLAGAGVEATLVGDASLTRRPMGRLARPLRALGASVAGAMAGNGELYPPLSLEPARLRGAKLAPEIPSAQVKGSLLLAGLYAEGTTEIVEALPTRDHTERLLRRMGAPLEGSAGRWRISRAAQLLPPGEVVVPGDPSSAAFLLAAAAAIPGSDLTLERISLNPGRRAFLDVLVRMGAILTESPSPDDGWEPTGDVRVQGGALRSVTLAAADIPSLIDEIPILAAIACFASGTTEISGAAELRVKESDRLRAMARGLGALGARVEERPDGLLIEGGAPLRGARLDAAGDHRVAMALAIAAGGARGESVLAGAEWVDISFPGFFGELGRLSGAA